VQKGEQRQAEEQAQIRPQDSGADVFGGVPQVARRLFSIRRSYQTFATFLEDMSFSGLRVLSLESRKAKEMATLIERSGGVAMVAPSVQERAIEDHNIAFDFLHQLEAGAFDMVICMTGVGIAFLKEVVVTKEPVERLAKALRKTTIVSRGPKPVGILREIGVDIDIMIPEPNTWREIVEAVTVRPERRIAIQDYGRPNLEFNQALEKLGAQVSSIELYRWEMPNDRQPLRDAAAKLAAGQMDVVLFTSSIQLDHLLEAAAEMGQRDAVLDALRNKMVIASVGPVMTAWLKAMAIPVHVEPIHPKMPSLVKAAAELSAGVLADIRKTP